VILSERLPPGAEVYHFYVHGDYGTWVAQGNAVVSPEDLASQIPDELASERDQAMSSGQRLHQELRRLEQQKQRLEQEIATIQAERGRFLDSQTQLQSEHNQQLVQLNALHYLVGVQDSLENEEIIKIPLFGMAVSGRNWKDAVFTQHLDLRSGNTILIKARDLGLPQISKVRVVPGSYILDEHYRLTFRSDRQTATIELLTLPRFKNDKVVFAVSE
jgi:hypothetical protein